MDIKFNEGDFVKNRDGRIGYISHICKCDECKKRRFLEPTIVYTDGSKEDISKSMLINVPANYEQIGNQIFGNEFMIEKLKEENKELNRLIEFAENQIELLHHKIENMEKDKDKIVKEDLYTHVKRTLFTENGKKFLVGDEIAFSKINKVTDHKDRYIGMIIALEDDCMHLENVEVNRNRMGAVCIKYSDIIPDSFNYVHNE